MTLDPAAVSNGPGFPLYVGRAYRILNADGSAHTITLDSGSFTGTGVTAGNNQLTFGTDVGGCVVFTVVSATEVNICDLGDTTPSTVVKKKVDLPQKRVNTIMPINDVHRFHNHTSYEMLLYPEMKFSHVLTK